jgi:hypothetical protein
MLKATTIPLLLPQKWLKSNTPSASSWKIRNAHGANYW